MYICCGLASTSFTRSKTIQRLTSVQLGNSLAAKADKHATHHCNVSSRFSNDGRGAVLD